MINKNTNLIFSFTELMVMGAGRGGRVNQTAIIIENVQC